jgi:hypothetical protein
MFMDSSRTSSVESVSGKGVAPYTSLIEEHAAQLMDELFKDLTPEPDKSRQQASSRSSESSANFQKPSSLALRIQREAYAGADSLVVPCVEMEATLESFYPSNVEANVEEPLLHPPAEGLASKVVLGVTCLAFVGSIGLWAGLQFNPSSPQAAVARASAVAPVNAPVNSANSAFAEDLNQSLQAASSSTAVSPTPALALNPTEIPALPTRPPLNVSLAPSSSPPAMLTGKVPQASQVIAMAKLPKPTVPTTRKAAASNPSVNLSLPNRLPELTAAALPGGGLPNFAISSPVPPVARSAKAPITIQGILDLGDKSAMLIARNGSTQNVRIGEVLDSTGWVFLRVENGQAIIQRGSEIRSINGGEQF